MSAWYILNSLGFYQVCPGRPVYSIGRPLFDRAVLHLGNGQDLVITVRDNSPEKLNGKELSTPFFEHQDIADGAELEFVMGATPRR